MYRKPVCVHCQREYRTKKTGIILVDYASYGPFRYTLADLLECSRCRHQIVWGYGDHPTHKCADPEFSSTLLEYKRKDMLVKCH